MAQSEDQTLGNVVIEREGGKGPVALGAVDPVAMSELLCELAAAFGESS